MDFFSSLVHSFRPFVDDVDVAWQILHISIGAPCSVHSARWYIFNESINAAATRKIYIVLES